MGDREPGALRYSVEDRRRELGQNPHSDGQPRPTHCQLAQLHLEQRALLDGPAPSLSFQGGNLPGWAGEECWGEDPERSSCGSGDWPMGWPPGQ